MKIGIDISQVAYPGTGVAVYTEYLVKNLLQIDKKNEYILFGASLRQRERLNSFADRILRGNNNKSIWPIPPTALDILWNRLHILPVENFSGDVDVFHSSDWTQPPTKAKKVTTIHDLVIYKFPESSHPQIVATQKRRLNWVKKDCDLIIAVSENTKRDIVEILGITDAQIRVIYEAVASHFTQFSLLAKKVQGQEIQRIKSQYFLQKPYFLAVGTRTPRKNLDRLVGAFTSLNFKDVDLVIAGQAGWGKEELGKAKILGPVPNGHLPAMYAGAVAFVYPSLYEGFGIPVLEALACGCPVVISNTSSLPEVGGKAAIYVDPYDTSDIAEKIQYCLNLSNSARADLITKGKTQAHKFSWEKTARETLKVYEELG